MLCSKKKIMEFYVIAEFAEPAALIKVQLAVLFCVEFFDAILVLIGYKLYLKLLIIIE